MRQNSCHFIQACRVLNVCSKPIMPRTQTTNSITKKLALSGSITLEIIMYDTAKLRVMGSPKMGYSKKSINYGNGSKHEFNEIVF